MPYLKAKHLTAYGKRLNQESVQDNRTLIYNGRDIRFQSEVDLEYYIESQFNTIFSDLILVKRQYTIKTQRCDLLCCSKSNKQPVIIELKNEEDRGIVAQLIRYRKALLVKKPFVEQIDYSLPIKLIAIAPTFHEDNHTDKEASKFENDFEFLQFSIKNDNGSGKFKLCGRTHDIPYPIFGLAEVSTSYDTSNNSLPVFTRNFRSHLPLEYRNDFNTLRSLLITQPKVKEMVSRTYRKILYGTGEGENHKKLAEITNTGKGVQLFLWLPTQVETKIKVPIARFGLVLAENHNPFSKDSIVEWIVCTKTNIDIKEKQNPNKNLTFNRQGMVKWSQANMYLAQATMGGGNSFCLLLYLLKGITPPIDNEITRWWETYRTQTPTNLGWYVDLAIKTWNYRIK
ncbi:hypothetical protein C7Y66_14685 [Chroococcidiopsis sp. CCALA 051]|uniref:endonuclease NucS domain-containing protein n=1 Tax=Chroococcidiopsis sp. CCALA 051 TaxID=869949 RepID=UPI000D0CE7B6|nr:endonuclease NucS domain-containing protein [Chroococcidiopsis sp. CCALA 051]PSM48381.1 hypothetical protein C7Y66_14685 [Chroococcidiopsis sp. CCALA 051]